jgi:hypothetical protein
VEHILKLEVLYVGGDGLYGGGDGNAALDHRGQLPAKRSYIRGFYTSPALLFRGLFDGFHNPLDGDRRQPSLTKPGNYVTGGIGLSQPLFPQTRCVTASIFEGFHSTPYPV